MRHGLAALSPVLVSALAVASVPALGLAAPARATAAPVMSCTVTAEEDFVPGVQMASVPQSVSGTLHGSAPTTGPACTAAADGLVGVDAVFTGKGQATCLRDPMLSTVDLSGIMTITWKKADGRTGGSSQVNWVTRQVGLGSVTLTGTVSSGAFKGANVSVAGLSEDGVINVSGGCASGSPLTSVRTSATYLKVG